MTKKYIPYTYCITFKPTGKKYYGARYADGKYYTANPNDLWTTYFTSSKIIKSMIEKYGKDQFIVEVRKTFRTAQDTRDWEKKVLQRLKVTTNENWINLRIGVPDPKKCTSLGMKGHKHSPKTLALMSIRQSKENNPMWGKTHDAEARAKISATHKMPLVDKVGEERAAEITQKIVQTRRERNSCKLPKEARSKEAREKARQTMIGQKRTAKSKEQMRESRLAHARTNGPNYIVDGVVYECIGDVAKAFNITGATANGRMKSPSFSTWKKMESSDV